MAGVVQGDSHPVRNESAFEVLLDQEGKRPHDIPAEQPAVPCSIESNDHPLQYLIMIIWSYTMMQFLLQHSFLSSCNLTSAFNACCSNPQLHQA